ncbi:MXAN_2562 family outer membrane beta-barrel protein [Myxococcota bacterium]
MRPQLFCLPVLVAVSLVHVRPAQAKREILPQWGFEFRLGAYQPTMGDREEQRYYRGFWGDTRPLMLALEFDRYLTYVFGGNLGVYLQVGHWKVSGKTRLGAPGTISSDTAASASKGNTKNQLQIIPIGLGVVFRADFLKREWGVPLVGYAKAAFETVYWRCSVGSKTCRLGSGTFEGWTTGLSGALGVALNLDWIATARAKKHQVFVDSFFFAEIRTIWGDGFGDKKTLDVSDTMATFGIAFDFD